ncbi:hypothetical protein EV421DRAFT_1970266 [Armillaria borealis]|uniref:Uncharacterized protein n=1 Tax=Armillaria borealis TaxID=47425 RepID=A0AA39ML42_9AGAR|nr:hypothetical protein EV421DRAFT_1970266 [Armillaria borealis]
MAALMHAALGNSGLSGLGPYIDPLFWDRQLWQYQVLPPCVFSHALDLDEAGTDFNSNHLNIDWTTGSRFSYDQLDRSVLGIPEYAILGSSTNICRDDDSDSDSNRRYSLCGDGLGDVEGMSASEKDAGETKWQLYLIDSWEQDSDNATAARSPYHPSLGSSLGRAANGFLAIDFGASPAHGKRTVTLTAQNACYRFIEGPSLNYNDGEGKDKRSYSRVADTGGRVRSGLCGGVGGGNTWRGRWVAVGVIEVHAGIYWLLHGLPDGDYFIMPGKVSTDGEHLMHHHRPHGRDAKFLIRTEAFGIDPKEAGVAPKRALLGLCCSLFVCRHVPARSNPDCAKTDSIQTKSTNRPHTYFASARVGSRIYF